ncbi:MAG: hypothetical protein WCX64_00445 [Candidatus Micrarchaeia archaeon]|jgi:hypothetical protein
MRRAFVFTADAIFALMLLGSVAMMFSIYSTQTEYAAKTTLLQALAYDYATLSQPPANLTNSTFTTKTGLYAFTREEDIPAGRQLVAAATRYSYNNSCNAMDCGKSCRITKDDAINATGSGCLKSQVLGEYGIIRTKAWVATP